MLRSITIDGYKSLCGVTLELNQSGPTVLLGLNGSGKSSYFGALELASRLTSELVDKRIRDELPALLHKQDPTGSVALTCALEDGTTWMIELRRQQPHISSEWIRSGGSEFNRTEAQNRRHNGAQSLRDTASLPLNDVLWDANASLQPHGWPMWARSLANALGGTRIAELSARSIASPATPSSAVSVDGFGLPARLLALQNSDRRAFNEIEATFRKLFPWVSEVQTPLEQRGKDWRVALRFKERGAEGSYDAAHMASGMLMALALLWMIKRPEPDTILCLEEPENSLHPHLLRFMYDLLGKASRGELGAPPVQVLVATHSVDFVNLCSPGEVRICERNEDGTASIHAINDDAELSEALDAYRGALGELWYSGALGGVPRDARTGTG